MLAYFNNNVYTSICAIHGLSGHAFESWMGTNKMWLRDLLPRESAFQKARIMTIGYNTKLFDHSTLASFQDLAHYVLTVVSMARRSAKVSYTWTKSSVKLDLFLTDLCSP